MKRKYAAMVLGLALSVTSMNVFAAETELTQTKTEEDAAGTENIADMADDGAADDGTVEISEETADSEDTETMAVWGEVTAAEEGSVTIKVADLQDAAGTEDTEAEETAETDSSTEAEEDADAENVADETEVSGAESYAELFTYTGEELNVMLNEETVVQLIYQDADAEKMQELAEEYSDTTAAAELTEAEEEASEEMASEVDAAEADTAQAGDAKEEPIVAELSIDAVLEGDMVYATIDDTGNVTNMIVFMPESAAETKEMSEEETAAEADGMMTADSASGETAAEENSEADSTETDNEAADAMTAEE